MREFASSKPARVAIAANQAESSRSLSCQSGSTRVAGAGRESVGVPTVKRSRSATGCPSADSTSQTSTQEPSVIGAEGSSSILEPEERAVRSSVEEVERNSNTSRKGRTGSLNSSRIERGAVESTSPAAGFEETSFACAETGVGAKEAHTPKASSSPASRRGTPAKRGQGEAGEAIDLFET